MSDLRQKILTLKLIFKLKVWVNRDFVFTFIQNNKILYIFLVEFLFCELLTLIFFNLDF